MTAPGDRAGRGVHLSVHGAGNVRVRSAAATRSLLDFIVAASRRSGYGAPFANQALTDAALNSNRHVLGTEALGKVLVQTLGLRTALTSGGFTSAIYIPFGALAGIFAGYFRRRVDDTITYIYSTLASVPEILLLISILFVLGPGLSSIAIALGVTRWVDLCRLVRGETMRQSERSYVAAARDRPNH